MRSSPVAILYEYYIINLKDRNIPPKKHYEIPFLRGCIAVYPLFIYPQTVTRQNIVASNNSFYSAVCEGMCRALLSI